MNLDVLIRDLAVQFGRGESELKARYKRILSLPSVKAQPNPEQFAMFVLQANLEMAKPTRCRTCGSTVDWDERFSFRNDSDEWYNFCTYYCAVAYIVNNFDDELDLDEDDLRRVKAVFQD